MTEERTNKVVVGMDSSDEAAAALRWAQAYAGADDAIVAIHSWETPYAVYMAVTPPQLGDLEQLAKEELERLLSGSGDARIVPMLLEGRPGESIVSEGRDADAIVIGHRGTSRVSMMLGSTANYVLHHATRPVIVVHGDGGSATRWVVVGVDDHGLDDGGDNHAVRALRWAYAVPGVERIEVLHAWSLQPTAYDFFGTVQLYERDVEAATAGVVDRVVDIAGPPPAGVELVRRVVRESAGRALLEASSGADLVVVGSRGRGGFTGLLLGSTSGEVAAHCAVPVAVIR